MKFNKGISKGAGIGLGCGGLVVVLIIIIAIASSGGNKNQTTTSTTKSGSQEATAGFKNEYKTGETVQLKNHQLIINSVDKNFKSSNMFDKPQSSENTFVVVDVTFINNGNKDIDVNEYGFKLEDETGTQRNTTFGGITDGKLQSVTLSPGGKTSGKIVFEAKADSKVLKLHYSPGLFGGSEVVVDL
jgi:hypothetical protein